jgi:hydrogenase nickel incorporation protein HypA/HybF
MHELGVVFEVVKSVEEFARQNGLTKIESLVLQIGELSAMIPRYIEDCYPAAVEGTMLADTKLRIEILPGNGLCRKCNKVYNLVQNESACPNCGAKDFEVLCGKEFNIKEIVAC